MSTEQRETLDAILRQSALPVGSGVDEQRRLFRERYRRSPCPADVTVTEAALGGVRTAEITVDGIKPRQVVLYFHGGVYVISDAFLAAGLASEVGRRTNAKVISVDYRLAPEHPYPAAVDDALAAYEALLDNGIAPSDIAFAGESAGGGLAIATMVNARDRGLRPAGRGVRDVTVCRSHPRRGDDGHQARGRPAAQPGSSSNPESPTTRRDKTPPLA